MPRRGLPVSSSRWSGFSPLAVHVHSRCSSRRTCTSFNLGFFLMYSTLATCPRQQPRREHLATPRTRHPQRLRARPHPGQEGARQQADLRPPTSDLLPAETQACQVGK